MAPGTRISAFAVFVVVAALAGCQAVAEASDSTPLTAVSIGDNVSPVIAARIIASISNVSQNTVKVYKAADSLPDPSTLASGSFVIALGNATSTAKYVNASVLAAAGSEGFVLATELTSGGVSVLAADGNALVPDVMAIGGNNGANYGAYAAMSALGFVYWHPLQPTAPSKLLAVDQDPTDGLVVDVEWPYWPVRQWHIHTEHPLELTDLLNGFPLPGEPTTIASWDDMFPEWESYLEWLVANRQNRVEYLPLAANDWDWYAYSSTRQGRFLKLNTACNAFGVACGTDISLADHQQHAWRMVTSVDGTAAEQIAEIHESVDWMKAAGFNFFSLENGFSEFTHPACSVAVGWMNETVNYLAEKYPNTFCGIKAHCSSGQVCKDYLVTPHDINPWSNDTTTEEELNFNFTPMEADPRLAVFPHTVQIPTVTGQPSPSYGNKNFTFMLDFMFSQVGKRPVIFHPESAYWVNYDIDVPLWLPVYASNRLRDLRTIARIEPTLGKIDGQNVFDSGWEWGYWLHDVIIARSVWNPRMDIDDDDEAFVAVVTEVLAPFGSDNAPAIAKTIAGWASAELDLLILGLVNGTAPSDITSLNGIAYLQGWDTWADIQALFPHFTTQPLKLGMEMVRNPFAKPSYPEEVAPLLAAMAETFGALTASLASLPKVDAAVAPYLDELVDAATITSLRATEVYALYDYAYYWFEAPSKEWRDGRLSLALEAIKNATAIVERREAAYRVPVHRIGGWRTDGPTAYTNMYLWTVSTLFYMWRDAAKAVDTNLQALSPCYMNFIDPINVAFGEGVLENATALVYKYFGNDPDTEAWAACLHAPNASYVLPRDLNVTWPVPLPWDA